MDGINTVNVQSGNNIIDINDGETTTLNLSKGNNTVNINGDSSVSNLAIEYGNNTINLKDTATATLAGTKGNTTVNIEGTSAIQGQLGSGKDIIKINSTHSTGVITNLGAGNDTVTVINATSKSFYGEKGNDIFTMTAGTTVLLDGGDGKDKFTISNCTSSRFNGGNDADTFIFEAGTGTYVYGGFGKDVFTINGGDGNIFFGEEDNDVFNVKAGTCGVSGGAGNDIFNIEDGKVDLAGGDGNDIINIKGGNNHTINAEGGDDTYNLYLGAKAAISDADGSNTYNIKKGYTGNAKIYNSNADSSKIVFEDRSLKLSNAKNVENDSVVTNEKTLTIWASFNFANSQFSNDYIMLCYDMQNEIEDKSINENYVRIDLAESFGSYTIGGKKYTLNLNQLKEDLVKWYTDNSASLDENVVSSNNIWQFGTEAQIKSLVSVFTKDTSECFIKA